jgi:hypothetical protein
MFFVVISIVVLVGRVIAGIVSARLSGRTIHARIAAGEFCLSLVAQLTQCKLLLVFQFATDVGVLAVRLPALG